MRRSTPARGADRDPVERPGQLAAVGVGVHPHRPADRPRDVDAELQSGKAPAGRLRGRRGQPNAGAAEQRARRRVRSAPGHHRASEHEPSKTIVRYQEVRSRPHHSYPRPPTPPRSRAARSARSSLAGPGEHVGAAARPDRRQPGQRRSPARSPRRAHRAPSPTSRSPSLKTSPAPRVTSRSPSSSRSARTRSRPLDVAEPAAPGAPGAASAAASATSRPLTPGERPDRLLAGRIDVEHADLVGSRQRSPEARRERLRPRVEVGLKDRDQAPVRELAERRQRRRDLGRVVGVVVVDDRARPRSPCARGGGPSQGSSRAPRSGPRCVGRPRSQLARAACRAPTPRSRWRRCGDPEPTSRTSRSPIAAAGDPEPASRPRTAATSVASRGGRDGGARSGRRLDARTRAPTRRRREPRARVSAGRTRLRPRSA